MDGRFVGRLFLAAAAALLLLFAASCTTASDGSRTGRRPILLAGAGDSETIAEPAIKDSQQSTRVAPPGRRLRRWNIRSREERPALDDGAGGVREADAPAAVGVCERQQRAQTNLVQLIPSIPGSDLSRDDGRCSRRHASINQAWSACMALPECAGVVRDNGIACGGGARLPFELRAGAPVPSRKTNAWVCPARLQAAAAAEAVARPPALGSPALREGFLFILHGGCARPDYSCTHVNELKEAVASLQVLPLGGRPIAVISDGGIPAAHLTKSLGVTYVSSLDHAVSSHANSVVSLPVVVSSLAAAISSRAGGAAAGSISGAAEELSALDDDLRVKKLRAYPASLFERTVFLDGDTLVRSPEALSLFSLLDAFDLAAAFECCRLRWSDPKTPYDRTGLMKGWEMQTGVMAYARNSRTASFFAETRRLYLSKGGGRYWSARSSGEQGAATLALASTDVRFFPLPPAFNARPYTMFQWARVFGVAVYHGKDLWRRRADEGAPGAGTMATPDEMVAYRLARDWEQAARGMRQHRGAPY